MRVVMVSVIFLLVGVLAASLASKVRSRASFRAFADAIAGMRVIPTRWAGSVAAAAIAAEAVTATLLLWPRALLVASAAATVLFGGFTATLVAVLHRGAAVGCHCFGETSAPVSWPHVARSGFLCAASVGTMCWAIAGGSASPADVDAPQLLVAVAAAGVAVAALVRLDDLLWLVRGVSPAS
jgi:hypothetical protein